MPHSLLLVIAWAEADFYLHLFIHEASHAEKQPSQNDRTQHETLCYKEAFRYVEYLLEKKKRITLKSKVAEEQLLEEQ